MIFSANQIFSSDQALTATAVSTNVIDLGAVGIVPRAGAAAKRDIGKGTNIPIRVQVTQSFNNLTSLIVTVEQSVDEAFTSPVIAFTSPTYALADLAVGARDLLPEEVPVGVNLRYVRLKYTIAGTAPTLGKVFAGITMGNQTNGTQA